MQLLLTLFVLALCFFLLSVGTILFNKKIKGSCGGNENPCSCSALEKKICKSKSLNLNS